VPELPDISVTIEALQRRPGAQLLLLKPGWPRSIEALDERTTRRRKDPVAR
jgi:hypothetical protein